jgi:hypothetical protein
MLDGVEANSFQFQLLCHINTPILNVLLDFGVIEIKVSEHEIVIVAMLRVYLHNDQ